MNKFPWRNETPMNVDNRILKYKLEQLLRDNIMSITFCKVGGTDRTMKCTLKSTLLPESTSERKKTFPENVMPVWDVENNGWRSFRVDRVLDYITLKNEA